MKPWLKKNDRSACVNIFSEHLLTESYGKVCRPSLFCGKMKQMTGNKMFNKLTMFQYNF